MLECKVDNLRIEKYQGALLGVAVGDALGWPNEQNSKKIGNSKPTNVELFQSWKRRCGGKFWNHEEEINPGEYSDDTQLIIATARSLRYGANWNRYFTKYEIPAWLSYERGGGGATKRAAEVWKRGRKPWKLETENISDVRKYFDAGGNGVAMRILPHVFRNEDMVEEIMHQVVLNGIYTHGHPRALLGATLYAYALVCLSVYKGILGYGELVNMLIENHEKWAQFPRIQKLEDWIENADVVIGSQYIDLWDGVVTEAINLLSIAKNGLNQGALDMGNDVLVKLGCFDPKVNGSGTVTAVASIYLASKYASNPYIGLVEAANLNNADTDTLASMVGGLLGMLHGTEWLSAKWFDVQDYQFIKKLVQYSPVDPSKEVYSFTQLIPFDISNSGFKSKLKDAKVGDRIITHPFNLLTVIEKRLNKPIAKGISVYTIKLRSEEGQTIFIKTCEKVTSQMVMVPENDITEKMTGYKNRQSVNNNLDESKDVLTNREAVYRKTPQVLNEGIQKKSIPARKQVMITANKLRSFANVLPENIPIDQYLFIISDIMIEVDRASTGELDETTFNMLRNRWRKYNLTLQNIKRIIQILLNY